MNTGLDYRYRSERMARKKDITERELYDLEHSRPGRSYLVKTADTDGSECLTLKVTEEKPTDRPVRMHSKEHPSKRINRRAAMEKLLAAARAKDIDVSALIGEEVYEMVVKMFDEHMSVTDVAELYGCHRETVRAWVYGTKNSAYTKLKYWVPRK